MLPAFEETQNKNKEYKAYREELSKLIKKYQNIYNSGLDRLTLKILDENGEVKNEIDFMALANDLCALSYLYFYKLHNKSSTNDIIDAVLKNNSSESFFKEFMIRLVSLNEHPNLLKEDEVSSVLDTLLVKCSQSSTTSTNGASEITTLKKAAKIPSQNRQITARCSFYECEGHRSLEAADANNNKPDTRVTLDSKSYGWYVKLM